MTSRRITGGADVADVVDVVIIGSGFAGSLTALALRRLGRSVTLLERGTHPRFAIGESSTPLANLLLEEICDRYGLSEVRPLSKWGTWQRHCPAVAGGLKRGFSFFRHDLDAPFSDTDQHERQLLVAASPHDAIADTHWYRPDFDHFLVQQAVAAGVDYRDEVDVTSLRSDRGHAVLEGHRRGDVFRLQARFVIDASGPRGCLHRALGLGDHPLQWLPSTQGFFTHFTGVERWDHTVTVDTQRSPPFPVDDAALHHVFPGGWIWVLRFNNGITSAGAALTDALAASIDIGREGAWDRLLERLPSIAAQFRGARPTRSFIHTRRIAFRSATVVGPNWALLPSAAGVIDPLLSTGFPLTLLGVPRLLRVLELDRWDGAAFGAALSDYAERTDRELDATEQLVAALYSSMSDFEQFKRLTLLYFAAASFSETARRLGMPQKAQGFLMTDDPVFGPEMRACAALALSSPRGSDRLALFDRIDRAIAPIDVAGLTDRTRRDWYPVAAADLIGGASKLDASPRQIESLLERCGFKAVASPGTAIAS
jgi:tetracycline 7-halogenase / FADH2 O2-dependent halogenase